MHIKRFGIKLDRLKEDQIEMVRHWRNAQEIRSFMEYQDNITPEMQRKWFHSLDYLRDYYFLIELDNEPVGLIHTSGIDWNDKSGHSGLFVWNKELLGSHVPVLASLAMVDFFFSFCNLEKLFAKVMSNNPVAIKYNTRLGFKPTEGKGQKAFTQYILETDDYFKTTGHLHSMAESIGGAIKEVVIENELLSKLKALGAIATESRIFTTVVK